MSPTFSTAAMYFSKILSKHLFTFSNCRFSKQALKHIIIAIRISSQSEYVIAATLLRIPISQRWPSCISPTDANLTKVIHTSPTHNPDLCRLLCFSSYSKIKATEIGKACYLFTEYITYQVENAIIKPICRVGLIFVLMYNVRYCFF